MNYQSQAGSPTTVPHFNKKIGSVQSYLQELVSFLVCSEWCLIDFMQWSFNPPIQQPSGCVSKGSLEFGVFLFLLQPENIKYINPENPDYWDIFFGIAAFQSLLVLEGVSLPSSNITVNQYTSLANANKPYIDGSIVGTNLYEVYDQNWITALINHGKTVVAGNYYNNGTLMIPSNSNSTTITSLTNSNTIIVGLLSDWGTNQQPAQMVMNQLVQKNPDCIVHLGDIYYSGTPITNENCTYTPAGEEKTNLVGAWQYASANRSFTMNSNHEMYTGANGYFNDALGAATKIFSAQNGFSMFTLKVADWTILALDSAYNADPLELFMYGQLDVDGQNAQAAWIQQLSLDPNKVIVLTHHNAFDFDCSPTSQNLYTNFWNEVSGALGSDPYAWYWGHAHNGIIYTNPIEIWETIQTNPGSPPIEPITIKKLFETKTYCRCLGHAALPFGLATGLEVGKNNIYWFANHVNEITGLVYNGYVTLAFTVNNQNVCEAITETFYDISNDQPVQKTNRIF